VIDADIAVVTNVELDHAELAGLRRADIAREKAGIVKIGSTLVLGERDSALRPIFTAELPHASLPSATSWHLRAPNGPGGLRREPGDPTRRAPWGPRPGSGRHNCDNLLLAVAAVEEYLGSPLSTEDIDRLGTRIQLPGRTEIVHESPLVMFDGAHNPAALLALRGAMTELPRAAGPRVLVCGALRGRDLAPALARLAKDVDSVIVRATVSTGDASRPPRRCAGQHTGTETHRRSSRCPSGCPDHSRNSRDGSRHRLTAPAPPCPHGPPFAAEVAVNSDQSGPLGRLAPSPEQPGRRDDAW
jgi:dihydrofolate synthase/folylpolyglutamate synthase